MANSKLEKKVAELEKRLAPQDEVEVPDVIVWCAANPDGTLPADPPRREDHTVVTTPNGREYWYPKTKD